MDTARIESVHMNEVEGPNDYLMCDAYGAVVNHPWMVDGGLAPNQPAPHVGVIDLMDIEDTEIDFKPEIPDRQLESFEVGYSPEKTCRIPASQPRVADQHEDVPSQKSFGLHRFGVLLGCVWDIVDHVLQYQC